MLRTLILHNNYIKQLLTSKETIKLFKNEQPDIFFLLIEFFKFFKKISYIFENTSFEKIQGYECQTANPIAR